MTRPGRGIFDPAITQRPCRHPCAVWWHVHDSELPSNQVQGIGFDPDAAPQGVSDPTEVDDDE